MHASDLTRLDSLPNATGGIARLACARLREAGIELAPLLTKAGLTVEQVDDHSVRLKVGSQIRFLELAAEALQDDALGFQALRPAALQCAFRRH